LKGEGFMQQGKIITLSGISGIGKSYLKSYILSQNPDIQSLISVTTRSRRNNEVNGIDKFFFTLKEFEDANHNGELCVVNQVFENWYAYKKSQIDLCDTGVGLITELFYKNVFEFKNDFENTITVYVLPNDIEKTKNELYARNLDKNDLARRVKDIEDELEFFYKHREWFDIVIYNDYTNKTCDLLQMLLMQKIRGA
jgi:guanylate kinase